MSRRIENLNVGLDEDLQEQLQWLEPGYSSFRILRQSVDARSKSPHFVYSVEVFGQGETPEIQRITLDPVAFTDAPVVIVGAGPAGLFAALRLAERHIPCILLEQGSVTEKRTLAIARYWRQGLLDPRNNVGFGEGGAGLFSDGKLITRIKSPHIPYVMQRLVECGAPAEIEYLANPHVGSDRIRRVIPVLRQKLLSLGCEIRFDTQVRRLRFSGSQITGVELESGEVLSSNRVILACGHSAEDLFHRLREDGIFIEGKSFAVGLRIEHPQKLINQIQYKAAAEHPKLGAANYRLAAHDGASQTGVYSFCMCPGGYVLSAATSAAGLVCNGMSNYHRNSRFANAAIVVTIDHAQRFKDVFGGLQYRQELEAQAQLQVRSQSNARALPAQTLLDFLAQKSGPTVDSSSLSGVVPSRLDELFDESFRRSFESAIKRFDQSMRGFLSEKAQLHGVESRTSCPIRITRHPETLHSVSHQGLYPCGEGAGYAGGITSAACDGIRIAEAIAVECVSQTLETSR